MDVKLADWGSDESGLILGYAFKANQPPEAVDSKTAGALIAALKHQGEQAPTDEFLWLHFNLANTGTLRWLERNVSLSPSFFETLNNNMRSTRVEREENFLVAVVNDVHFDFSFDSSDISTLWVNLDNNVVVTARHLPLRSVDQLRTRIKAGLGFHSSAEFLEHVLRSQADVLVDIVRTVTARIDDIEDDLLAGKPGYKRVRLGSLRRLLVRLQRLLAPEPASLFRLLQHPPAWISPADVQALREASEEFSVVLSDMASLQERIKLLQEEVSAAMTEENNRTLFVLTAVTVLALPINIMAGLFGMNVGGIPLGQNPHGFWLVVLIILVVTLAGAWLMFWRRKDGS
jgi:zinc transporter